jgi:hypothetical protein
VLTGGGSVGIHSNYQLQQLPERKHKDCVAVSGQAASSFSSVTHLLDVRHHTVLYSDFFYIFNFHHFYPSPHATNYYTNSSLHNSNKSHDKRNPTYAVHRRSHGAPSIPSATIPCSNFEPRIRTAVMFETIHGHH